MTVNELIEQLKNYPADMRVLTLGYDGYVGGTNIQEVPYVETPATVDVCAPITISVAVFRFIYSFLFFQ